MKTDEFYDPRALGLRVAGTSGQEVIVVCPFHDDHHPSACFNPVTGLLFCFSCGATATVKELAKTLGGQVRRTSEIGQRRRTMKVEWHPLLASPPALGHPYLRGRQVTDEQVLRWGIRLVPGAVVFPVTNKNNVIVGVILRREQGSPRYLFFGEKPPLWPLGQLVDLDPRLPVFLTEGVFGKLRAELADVPAFAVMGASVNETISRYLAHRQVITVFDDDFAGYLGAGKVLFYLPGARAVIPGQEADELPLDEWRGIGRRDVLTTGSLATLAKLSGDPHRFFRCLPKTRSKQGWSRNINGRHGHR